MTSSDLYFYRLGSKKPSRIIDGFAGTVSADSLGGFSVLGKVGGKTYVGTVNETGGFRKLGIKKAKENTDFSYITSLDQRFNQLIANDQKNSLYILSKEPTQYEPAKTTPTSAKRIENEAYIVNYLESSNSFSILIRKNPFKQNIEKALKELQGHGVDTNQHIINANPIRTLNTN